MTTTFYTPPLRVCRSGSALVLAAALGLVPACGDDHDDHVHPPVDAGDGGHDHDAGRGDAGTGDAGPTDGGAGDGSHDHDAAMADDLGTTDMGPLDMGPGTRTIRFAARVGGRPFACGREYAIPGPAGTRSVTLDDFRFYVHGVELHRAGGDWVTATVVDDPPWQNRGVALLDFENRASPCTGTVETRDHVRVNVADGSYDRIRFVLGVPFEQNHQAASSAPAPLNLTDLFWNWQGGYKFVRIDARATMVVGDERPAFAVHLGSTGCDGSPSAGGTTTCMFPNRPVIELPFDPDHDVVVADFAELVEGLDVYVNGGGPSGCMSGRADPECSEVMRSFGIDFGGEPGAQDFFSVAHEGH